MDKNPHAVELGRLAAKARAETTTPEQRSEAARRGAVGRWGCSTDEKFLSRAIDLIRLGELRVDPDGSVWRLLLRGSPCVPRRIGYRMNMGYPGITVRLADGRSQPVLVHRLLWTIHVGPILAGMEINHKNGDRTDNRLDNLEVVTRMENARHARDVLGTAKDPPHPRGEAQHLAKLTEVTVAEIRRRYAEGGVSQRALAAEYGVHQAAVCLALKGSTWRGDGAPPPVENENAKHRQKLDPEKAREIRRRYVGGEKMNALAADFGCSRATVEAIVSGRIWKEAVT